MQAEILPRELVSLLCTLPGCHHLGACVGPMQSALVQAELLEQGLFSLLCIMLKQSLASTLLLPVLSALGNLTTDLDRCECCSLCWEDWQQLMPWPTLWQLCDSSDPRLQVPALGETLG